MYPDFVLVVLSTFWMHTTNRDIICNTWFHFLEEKISFAVKRIFLYQVKYDTVCIFWSFIACNFEHSCVCACLLYSLICDLLWDSKWLCKRNHVTADHWQQLIIYVFNEKWHIILKVQIYHYFEHIVYVAELIFNRGSGIIGNNSP